MNHAETLDRCAGCGRETPDQLPNEWEALDSTDDGLVVVCPSCVDPDEVDGRLRDDGVVNRALVDYLRSGRGYSIDHPESGYGVEWHDGKEYVVFRNCNGTLAVYRVRGWEPKRLQRWPKALGGIA